MKTKVQKISIQFDTNSDLYRHLCKVFNTDNPFELRRRIRDHLAMLPINGNAMKLGDATAEVLQHLMRDHLAMLPNGDAVKCGDATAEALQHLMRDHLAMLPETSTAPLFKENSNNPATTMLGPWPPSPIVAQFLIDTGYDPSILKPNPEWLNDLEMKHIEEKKTMLRDGWLYEGMNDPEASAAHALGDIADARPKNELSESARAAHRVARDKYRKWKVQQAMKKTKK